MSTNYEAPHYAVFSSHLLLSPLWFIYIIQHSALDHPQSLVITHCKRPSFTSGKIVFLYIEMYS